MLIAIAVWSAVFAGSLAWNWAQTKKNTQEIAYVQIRLALEKDVLYRHWNANCGGLYVEVSDVVEPNPYLSHIPERDVVTPSGRKLTLVNPAYMSRQVNEFGKIRKSTTLTRITSLQPVNSLNTPDPWERQALQAVSKGEKEVVTVEKRDDMTVLRLLQPFVTEKSCLKCHGAQGSKEGEIRGGISVWMSLDHLLALEQQKIREILIGHLALWGVGMVGILITLMQLKKAQEKQQQTKNELIRSRKIEGIGLLAGGMAHDFNNLLSIVCGNLGLIKAFGPKPDERLERSYQGAEQACGQAKELGLLLLDLSSSGDPKREVVDLKQLLADIQSQVPQPANITSQIVFSETSAFVRGNYRMILRMLRNLIVNAFEAMPNGGVLKVNAKDYIVKKGDTLPVAMGDYVELSIQDTGKGIPPEILLKIFDPYFTTKDTYIQRGLGLGLAVCEVIVKRLGGVITVASTIGEGTVFKIYLPSARLAAPGEKSDRSGNAA